MPQDGLESARTLLLPDASHVHAMWDAEEGPDDSAEQDAEEPEEEEEEEEEAEHDGENAAAYFEEQRQLRQREEDATAMRVMLQGGFLRTALQRAREAFEAISAGVAAEGSEQDWAFEVPVAAGLEGAGGDDNFEGAAVDASSRGYDGSAPQATRAQQGDAAPAAAPFTTEWARHSAEWLKCVRQELLSDETFLDNGKANLFVASATAMRELEQEGFGPAVAARTYDLVAKAVVERKVEEWLPAAQRAVVLIERVMQRYRNIQQQLQNEARELGRMYRARALARRELVRNSSQLLEIIMTQPPCVASARKQLVAGGARPSSRGGRDASAAPRARATPPWPAYMAKDLAVLLRDVKESQDLRTFMAEWNAAYAPDVYFAFLRRNLFSSLSELQDIVKRTAVDCRLFAEFHSESTEAPPTCGMSAEEGRPGGGGVAGWLARAMAKQ